jgi:hypothetical protein
VGLCAAGGALRTPALCGDGAGGALVVWQDGRPGALGQDVYAQRVNSGGVAQWAADGVGLCTAAADQVGPAIAADPMGGAVVAWSDARTAGNGPDIYAQHVNVAGGVQWTANGVQVCDAPNAQDGAMVIPDGLGGAVVVWRDLRTVTDYDIYGQRVDASGQLADQCPTPDSLSNTVVVSTVASQNYRTFDQSHFAWSGVAVRGLSGDWDIEVYDQGSFGLNPYPTCFGLPLAGSFGSSTVDFVVGDFNDLQTPPGNYGLRAYRYSGTGGAEIEWDCDRGLTVGATGASVPNWTGPLDVYNVDLSAGVTYWFQVIHSPAVDIRALLFSSAASSDGFYMAPRSARVLECFSLSGYTAPVTDRYGVVVVNETGVSDNYTLKVLTVPPTGVEEPLRGLATGLRGVAPNPSAGQVQIQFAMREAGAAAFDVLDMAGRVVARIPGRQWEAGTWSVGWDGRSSRGTQAAPGIYFVQMRVDGRRVGLGRLALIR